MPAYKLEFVSCHRKPERSFFWKGRQFPVCARCTGLYLGYLSFPLFSLGIWQLGPLIATLMVLPTLIDGLTQAYCNRESFNWLRFSTGLIAGAGMMELMVLFGNYLGHFIFD
ncbi:MAG: DUF2085 domain-containing protein [Chitinophagaceae bacterium]|nr:MAG: DUF2085 domain-containing protein [Chitinophagaceae bacterium]